MGKELSPEVQLSVKVSKLSAEGWKNFCDKNGITLSAFIEIAGLELIDETAPPAIRERQIMVEKARQVDQKRRSRKKKT